MYATKKRFKQENNSFKYKGAKEVWPSAKASGRDCIASGEKKKKMINKPNMLYEIIMSVIKWFLIFVLINNAIWFGVVYSLTNGSNIAEITQTQDGENNTQEMTNG